MNKIDELVGWRDGPMGSAYWELVDYARKIESELTEAREQLETERMRLAACGVIALADTEGSRDMARDIHPDYESASAHDVARRVDECIELRQRLKTEEERHQFELDGTQEWVDRLRERLTESREREEHLTLLADGLRALLDGQEGRHKKVVAELTRITDLYVEALDDSGDEATAKDIRRWQQRILDL
jgi:hypothetical protein